VRDEEAEERRGDVQWDAPQRGGSLRFTVTLLDRRDFRCVQVLGLDLAGSERQCSYAYQQLTFQPCSDTDAQSNAVPEEA
jgi:hypothetical protein